MTRCRDANANVDANADVKLALMLVMLKDTGEACVCADVMDNAMLCAKA